MKTDRLAVLLAGLLILGGCLPAGTKFTLNLGGATATIELPSAKLAKAIALQVQQVQQRFAANRNALPTVKGQGGKSAYLRQDVTGLITRTGEDLDQAIAQAQPSGTEPLRAWSAEEIRRIQEELSPLGPTASLPGSFTPRVIAVVAGLQRLRLPMLAKAEPVHPKQETVAAGIANRLLDQVGEMVNRIFFLADHGDLEVTLWVGSTPEQQAKFTFWPKGSTQEAMKPIIITTDSTKRNVLRGLYSYEADWPLEGAVTQKITSSDPKAPLKPESALDLVRDSSFFCCRFGNGGYCQHVDDEKSCR